MDEAKLKQALEAKAAAKKGAVAAVAHECMGDKCDGKCSDPKCAKKAKPAAFSALGAAVKAKTAGACASTEPATKRFAKVMSSKVKAEPKK